MIRLEEVTERTFSKIIKMKLDDEQSRFVAPNVVSLAQAWLYYDETRPFAVCDGDEPVGFMMLDWDENERTVGIWRFMIAQEQQRKGFGRAAMEAAIEMIKSAADGSGGKKFDMIHLDYVPGNTAARELYYSLGFRENGDVEDGEIIMTLPLTDSPKVGMLTADGEDSDGIIEIFRAEKARGAADAALSEKLILSAIAEGGVTRFTVMGKTIGFALADMLLIGSEYASYRTEAAGRLADRDK